MGSGKNYYQILGVDSKATPAEIRKAQKRLARKYHPDSQDESATPDREKFQEVTEAWTTLKDPEERAAYDRQSQQARSAEGGQRRGQSTWDKAFNLDDIFGPAQWINFGWGRPEPQDYFLFPENDLGLLQALILAYQSKADGKWEVKKAPTDSREFMPEAVWRVKREGNRVYVFRRVNDWRTISSQGEPIKVANQRDFLKVEKTLETTVFLGEYYFSGQGEKQIRYSVRIPPTLPNYLRAMKSLAGKIARKEKNQDGGYDVFNEAEIIRSYTRSARTKPEGASYSADYETARKIPYSDFWDELMKASALVQQIEPKSKIEGQRVKVGEQPFNPQDAGGEAKG